MAVACRIIAGPQTKDFTLTDDSAEGLKFTVKTYNQRQGTTLNVADYLALQIINWAGDAAHQRRRYFAADMNKAYNNSTEAVQQQVLTLLGIEEP